MSSFYEKFSAFLAQHRLIPENSTVIAGVSGGVDSMVMLQCLLEYRKEKNIRLIATHLNHQLRGPAADQDERTVRDFCREKDCEFVSKTVDIKKLAQAQRVSLEMAGRDARYRFFQEISNTDPDALIATAHTADDQVETVLYRIFKGTGINGLRGIRVKRGNIIRPLLFARKADIYSYAEENGIPFSEDHTNRDTTIPRNYIRHTLIPSLKSKINPSLEHAILHLSEIFSDLDRLNKNSAQEAWEQCLIRRTATEIALDIPHLKKYLNTVIFEVIRESVNRLHSEATDLNYNIMENIVRLMHSGQTGSQQKITADITAFLNRNELILRRNDIPSWTEFAITPGQSYSNNFFDFSTAVLNIDDFKPDKEDKNTEYVDLDKVAGSQLFLRPWRNADRITPLGSSHSKKISDVFVDQKVPLHKKKQIPLLLCGESIVWVCGCKLSDLYKVDSNTKHILKLSYKEKTDDKDNPAG